MISALIILAGLAGVVAHWAKSSYRGTLPNGLVDYFFKSNKVATVRTVATLTAALAGIIATNPELSMSVISTAFLAGFSADSALNSGEEPS